MNIYSASVALLWTTALGAAAPPRAARRAYADGVTAKGLRGTGTTAASSAGCAAKSRAKSPRPGACPLDKQLAGAAKSA